MQTIGDCAFKDCTSLITPISNNVTSIGEEAFENTAIRILQINNLVQSIGDYAFKDCKDLMEVHFHKVVGNEPCTASFGTGVFEGCISLEFINFENASIQTIGTEMFKGCISLRYIALPNSLQTIGKGAFNGCNNLQSIEVPFVGGSVNGGSDQFFGYIFGEAGYGGYDPCYWVDLTS